MSKDKQSSKMQEDMEIQSAFDDIAPPKKEKARLKTGLIISLCAVVIVLAVILIAGFSYYNNVYLNGVILDNVTVEIGRASCRERV